MRPIRISGVLLAALLMSVGCAPAPQQTAEPGADSGTVAETTTTTTTTPPATQQQGEFGSSHHALVDGVVVGRGGAPLDSVTVVAWRMAEGRGSVAQLRAVTGRDGRFRLQVQAHVGPEQTPVPARVVLRGFAYASRYPRGPEGRVALDSAVVPLTLVPMSQPAPVTQARITLPLP